MDDVSNEKLYCYAFCIRTKKGNMTSDIYFTNEQISSYDSYNKFIDHVAVTDFINSNDFVITSLSLLN